MQSLAASITAYERDLRGVFGPCFVEADLKTKHEKMRESAFVFLRATCWRWAEAAAELCPELMDAPAVGCVGDAHAENFGLWRDSDARLVWGVNDFDEAAVTPYGLDLVRLCASMLLADAATGARDLAAQVLEGYRRGLEAPEAFVLERDHLWLRDAFAASDEKREAFWAELEASAEARDAPPAYRTPVVAVLPACGAVRVVARTAGAGSLGRPRYVAFGQHAGGPVAREIKGRAPSCWKDGRDPGLAARLVAGLWRSPDPYLVVADAHVLRRLAPNSSKLKLERLGPKLGDRLVRAMARDLAAIHIAQEGSRAAIEADLARREDDWLAGAARHVAQWTEDEFKTYSA